MKTKDELRRELDQTQQVINAAETAMRLGLTLDEDSFDRYTDAMERQKQIAEALRGCDKGLTVAELIHCGLEDVHLLHADEEIDVATIDRLTSDTITEAGFREWYDVMSAKVERIYTGFYGLQVDVSGCEPERLTDFSYALAGYCSEEDYDRWFRDEPDETNENKMGMEMT